MARILSLSSQVVYGHVGNSVTGLVLQRLGHDVWSVPTIVLSNRPDYPAVAGTRIDTAVIGRMLEAGLENGWLRRVHAVMTGYLPSPAHVELCAAWVRRLRAEIPGLTVLCDPVLGDEPGGVYIEAAAAEALRDTLLPLADIATPNRFELGWLTGRQIERLDDAATAAAGLGPATVLVTSAPGGDAASLCNLLINRDGRFTTSVTRLQLLAHGTGDFIAAAFLARLLDGQDAPAALAFATAAMQEAIALSGGAEELQLVQSQHRWADASPAPVMRMDPAERVAP
jgi:pyridoxine kinase